MHFEIYRLLICGQLFQMIQNEFKSEHSLFKEVTVTVLIFTRTESPTVTAVSAGGSLIAQKADAPGNSSV